MHTFTLQDLCSQGVGIIPDEDIACLIVNGRTKSVCVPPKKFAKLLAALEELEDIKAIEEAENEKTVPFSMRKANMIEVSLFRSRSSSWLTAGSGLLLEM